MSIFSKIFSKPIDPSKLIDFASGAIDRMRFTDQEKAEHNLRMAAAVADFAKDTLNESTDKSVTRRYLSIFIIAVYLLIVLFTIAIAMWDIDRASAVLKIMSEYYLTTGFVMVLAFFYSGYYVNGIIGKANEKK